MTVDNNKHAYLIMAHNNFNQLRTLIKMLDDPRNDIYLHIDKKAGPIKSEMFKTEYSDLVMTKRIKVNWGGHSQIKCEIELLKAATQKCYQYYHLISGIDLPIKSQDEIHAFFDRAKNTNFIRFDKKANEAGIYNSRITYYYFFQDVIGRNAGRIIALLEKAEEVSLLLQKKLGLKRKQYVTPYKGTNWFSINNELAKYILANEKMIKKQFYYSKCADEMFLHSLVMASPYKDSIEDNSLRAIDWERGTPYTYRAEDVEKLISSSFLFARKFDSRVDQAAIDKVEYLLSQR